MSGQTPGQIGERLRDRGETIAVAESATGGLIGSLLTDVSGSSDYFDRSLVTYSNDAKQQHLCIPREHLDRHGAVSEPVARAMARGIRDTAGTDWGVATTGIAGPTGGTPDKPVGTVFIGVAYAAPWGSEASFSDVHHYTVDSLESRIDRKRAFADRALEAVDSAMDTVERR